MYRQVQLHVLSILVLKSDQKKNDILATYLPSNSLLCVLFHFHQLSHVFWLLSQLCCIFSLLLVLTKGRYAMQV